MATDLIIWNVYGVLVPYHSHTVRYSKHTGIGMQATSRSDYNAHGSDFEFNTTPDQTENKMLQISFFTKL